MAPPRGEIYNTGNVTARSDPLASKLAVKLTVSTMYLIRAVLYSSHKIGLT